MRRTSRPGRTSASSRCAPAARGWPADLPQHDFWLLDSSLLFAAHYAADGYWLGVELVTDPTAIAAACRWRDAALHHSQPWADYIRTRPALTSRLPTA